jgi:hypothetical protein
VFCSIFAKNTISKQAIMNRRNFLQTGFLATTSTLVANNLLHPSGNISNNFEINNNSIVYTAESGIYGKDTTFVLGFLIVEELQKSLIENQFKDYRQENDFKAKLTYSSNNKHKLSLAKAMITNFVKSSSMRFCARIIHTDESNEQSSIQYTSFGKLAIEKVEVYKQLYKVGNLSRASLLMKSQSPYGPSAYFKDQLSVAVDDKVSINAVNTMSSDLLQLAGLLTGSVRASFLKKTKDPVKDAINEHLLTLLNLKEITNNSFGNQKFIIF